MQVIRRKGIVYIGLDALTDTAVSAVVGNAMSRKYTTADHWWLMADKGNWHG